jgi:hypothetical protein
MAQYSRIRLDVFIDQSDLAAMSMLADIGKTMTTTEQIFTNMKGVLTELTIGPARGPKDLIRRTAEKSAGKSESLAALDRLTEAASRPTPKLVEPEEKPPVPNGEV